MVLVDACNVVVMQLVMTRPSVLTCDTLIFGDGRHHYNCRSVTSRPLIRSYTLHCMGRV